MSSNSMDQHLTQTKRLKKKKLKAAAIWKLTRFREGHAGTKHAQVKESSSHLCLLQGKYAAVNLICISKSDSSGIFC